MTKKPTKKPLVAVLAVTALLLAGCSSSSEEAPATTPSPSQADAEPPSGDGRDYTGPELVGLTTDDFDVTVVTDELNYPWEVRESEGALILTEVAGTIAMVDHEDRFDRYEVDTSDPVMHDGGSGLMGLDLAEDFADSGTAYIYYTYEGDNGLTNRIAEVTFDGDSWEETQVLLDGIPGHNLYNGGRIAIGPDDHLYATTGWTSDNDVSQDLDSLAGKILRVNLDGSVPEDNPFDDSYVYSYGHRNPQGLAWDADGQLFSAEHGEAANDEINLITPGTNYGWPLAEGDDEQDGMETPYLSSGSDTWAPSGIAFAGDDLVVAALAAQILYVMNDEEQTVDPLFSSGERARTVLPYQDGIYVTSTNTSPRATEGSESVDRLLWIRPAS
ncbi:PQQ-dependent sugar dehydrogenase [Corynebacterium glyciniphilum]|uniref:PQQ-dependent sugar dehydrogenase n=1 Tax=Corynebacterium glyciniphilum TaxID=1404244 RepID=UPI003DA0644F